MYYLNGHGRIERGLIEHELIEQGAGFAAATLAGEHGILGSLPTIKGITTMTLLIAGLFLFIAPHSIRILADEFRARQIAKIGALPWKGIYALVSLAGFVLIVYGYGATRVDPAILWTPPPWTRPVAALLLLPAFVLLAAAYVPATHIKAAVGHPMLLSVKVWALAHLIANGTLGDVLLFGAFLLWSVAAYAAARRRDRKSGTRYPAGRLTRDIIALAVGFAAWIAFALWLHAWMIGVRPFG